MTSSSLASAARENAVEEGHNHPGFQDIEVLAASANDLLAETVKKHPTRYTGLASFAPQDPKRAAKEIERAINTLKLNGLIEIAAYRFLSDLEILHRIY